MTVGQVDMANIRSWSIKGGHDPEMFKNTKEWQTRLKEGRVCVPMIGHIKRSGPNGQEELCLKAGCDFRWWGVVMFVPPPLLGVVSDLLINRTVIRGQ